MTTAALRPVLAGLAALALLVALAPHALFADHHGPPAAGKPPGPGDAGAPLGPPRSMTDDAFAEEARPSKRPDRFSPEELDAQLDAVMHVITDIDPEMAQRFAQLKNERPGASVAVIQRRFPEAFWLVRLREQDPEMYELRVDDLVLYRRSETLARELRGARQNQDDDDVADDLTDALTETLEQHFDVQTAIKGLEIERLEARIEALKDALRDRSRRDDELIEMRFDRLMQPRSDRPGGRGQDQRRDRDQERVQERGQDRERDRPRPRD